MENLDSDEAADASGVRAHWHCHRLRRNRDQPPRRVELVLPDTGVDFVGDEEIYDLDFTTTAN